VLSVATAQVGGTIDRGRLSRAIVQSMVEAGTEGRSWLRARLTRSRERNAIASWLEAQLASDEPAPKERAQGAPTGGCSPKGWQETMIENLKDGAQAGLAKPEGDPPKEDYTLYMYPQSDQLAADWARFRMWTTLVGPQAPEVWAGRVVALLSKELLRDPKLQPVGAQLLRRDHYDALLLILDAARDGVRALRGAGFFIGVLVLASSAGVVVLVLILG
jgi:hypothetical protein